jgi:hypothetical protein
MTSSEMVKIMVSRNPCLLAHVFRKTMWKGESERNCWSEASRYPRPQTRHHRVDSAAEVLEAREAQKGEISRFEIPSFVLSLLTDYKSQPWKWFYSDYVYGRMGWDYQPSVCADVMMSAEVEPASINSARIEGVPHLAGQAIRW